ncbi:hypothetical protein B0H10DRAFT_1940360 [Mycena sp. CBHHK59/15]|nr:hypothetical protein B0H10DRAFT_1940360 [Mycena sp. CBHHK59/15]
MLVDCKAECKIADLNTVIYLLICVTYICGQRPVHPALLDCCDILAAASLTRFSYTADVADIQQAIACRMNMMIHNSSGSSFTDIQNYPTILAIDFDGGTIDDDPDQLLTFASALLREFHQAVHLSTLDTAICLYREVLSFASSRESTHRLRRSTLQELSDALLARFRATGGAEYLQESISLLRKLHALHPSRAPLLCVALLTHTERPIEFSQMEEPLLLLKTITATDAACMQLWSSGSELLCSFQNSGASYTLDDAVSRLRRAGTDISWGHPGQAAILTDLGRGLQLRFSKSGTGGDLDTAIGLHCPHVDHGTSLIHLGLSLYERFLQSGDIIMLNETVDLLAEAADVTPTTHMDQAEALTNLGSALCDRFAQRGNEVDLETGIRFHREALDLRPAPHPNCPECLGNLGNSLCMLFAHTGDVGSLDTAIELEQESLALRPLLHPGHDSALAKLGTSLHTRFPLGDATDLDTAVQMQREALALRPRAHPGHASSLYKLRDALHDRFIQRREMADLDNAIELLHAVIELCPVPHPDHTESLNVLAVMIRTRYRERGDVRDLDRSIELDSECLTLRAATHPGRSGSLTQLGNSLATRYAHKGDIRDLQAGIQRHQEALSLRPVTDTNHAISLMNLATSVHQRFLEGRDPSDFKTSITLIREALPLRPPPHPSRGRVLLNLTVFLSNNYHFLQTPKTCLDEEAVILFCEASTYISSPVSQRLKAAETWALLTGHANHESVLEAYSICVG